MSTVDRKSKEMKYPYLLISHCSSSSPARHLETIATRAVAETKLLVFEPFVAARHPPLDEYVRSISD
jgi:hypothetical protein